MEKDKFLTTDNYKLGVDIDLSLSEEFFKALQQESMEDVLPSVVKRAVGRDDIKILVDPTASAGGVGGCYEIYDDRVSVDPGKNTQYIVSSFSIIAPDNLPPNIPEELTPELFGFLMALHESEHVTQYTFEGSIFKKQQTEFDPRAPDFGCDDKQVSEIAETIIAEVDAELAVLKFLREQEMNHVAQFYLDMRCVSSFTKTCPYLFEKNLDHDVSTIISHYEETGEVLDPDKFLEEKKELLDKLHKEMGVGSEWIDSIMTKNQSDGIRKLHPAEIESVVKQLPPMPPQVIMHALQSLLDKGELDGLQKLEAENFIEAVKHMGYEPDPNPAFMEEYKEQVNGAIVKHMNEFGKTGQEIDLSTNVSSAPPP